MAGGGFQGFLRQNTQVIVHFGPLRSATDSFANEETAVNESLFRLVKHNGTTSTALTGATEGHISRGVFYITLTTTHTNTVGILYIGFCDTANETPSHSWMVVEEAVYDALYAADAEGFSGAATDLTEVNASLSYLKTAVRNIELALKFQSSPLKR